jgi:hypothetical protein
MFCSQKLRIKMLYFTESGWTLPDMRRFRSLVRVRLRGPNQNLAQPNLSGLANWRSRRSQPLRTTAGHKHDHEHSPQNADIALGHQHHVRTRLRMRGRVGFAIRPLRSSKVVSARAIRHQLRAQHRCDTDTLGARENAGGFPKRRLIHRTLVNFIGSGYSSWTFRPDSGPASSGFIAPNGRPVLLS